MDRIGEFSLFEMCASTIDQTTLSRLSEERTLRHDCKLKKCCRSIGRLLTRGESIIVTLTLKETLTCACLRCMKFLLYHFEHESPMSVLSACPTYPVNKIVQVGSLECLKFLHHAGYPWNEDTCKQAIYNNRLECLTYMIQNGCSYNIHVLQTDAFVVDNPEILRYVVTLNADRRHIMSLCFSAIEWGSVKCMRMILSSYDENFNGRDDDDNPQRYLLASRNRNNDPLWRSEISSMVSAKLKRQSYRLQRYSRQATETNRRRSLAICSMLTRQLECLKLLQKFDTQARYAVLINQCLTIINLCNK